MTDSVGFSQQGNGISRDSKCGLIRRGEPSLGAKNLQLPDLWLRPIIILVESLVERRVGKSRPRFPEVTIGLSFPLLPLLLHLIGLRALLPVGAWIAHLVAIKQQLMGTTWWEWMVSGISKLGHRGLE